MFLGVGLNFKHGFGKLGRGGAQVDEVEKAVNLIDTCFTA